MGMLGGDILSLLSVIGSAVVLLDSLVNNSPLHRLGNFFDMSVVCLIMGTIGQFAIAYTGAQVERVGFLQIHILIVNRLLILSFLFLLISWFIRRSRAQVMRLWGNISPSIWRGATKVNKHGLRIITGEIMYMDKDIVSMANQFGIYNKVGWYDSWQFRRHISWLEGDIVSLDYLLNFEKELKVDSITIRKIIEAMLAWYHSEVHDDRLLNRVPRQRLPAMLQIMAFFYGKSGRLNRSYRELIIGILQAEDEIKRYPEIHEWMPPEQFRLEVAKAISNLSNDWGRREGSYLTNGANHLLHYLTNIAKSSNDWQIFTQYQLEAASVTAKNGLNAAKFLCLETIASKVKNSHAFTLVFQSVVPAIGLENTSALMALMAIISVSLSSVTGGDPVPRPYLFGQKVLLNWSGFSPFWPRLQKISEGQGTLITHRPIRRGYSPSVPPAPCIRIRVRYVPGVWNLTGHASQKMTGCLTS